MGIVADVIHDWRDDWNIEAVEEPAAGLGLDGLVRLVTVDGEDVVVHVQDDATPPIDPAVKRLVQEQTGVPVPRILHEGRIDGRAYHVEERLPGASLQGRFVELDEAEQEDVLQDVGRLIAAVHDAVRFESSGELARDDPVRVADAVIWSSLLRDMVEPELAGLRDTRFADLAPVIEDAMHRGLDAVPDDVNAVLLHNDLGPSNVIGSGARVTGIVDWANAIAGDPLYDVARAERSFIDKRIGAESAERLRDALYRGYQERRDLELDARRDVYRLACSVEVLRWFPRWSAPLDDEVVAERARFWRGFIERLCTDIRGR